MDYLKSQRKGYLKPGKVVTMNTITVITKASYNEWIALLKETGVKYTIENRSDYSGFEVKLTWWE